MLELVPIKIKVTKGIDGKFIYPKFKKTLQFFKDNPDYKAFPLYYDKKSDCKTESEGSPMGQRWCMKLVPPEFAEQAIATYPSTVFEMTEEEAEEFYDERAMAHLQENKYDIQVLQGFQMELDLRERVGLSVTAIKTKIKKAINPDDDEPGINRNREKKWSNLKASMDLKIVKAKKS